MVLNCSTVGGDNDPLDVIEIGQTPLPLGIVTPVRLLGCLAMIDQGEIDWKILAIRAEDLRSGENIQNIEDIERVFPNVMSGIREWLRWYKTPGGKPLNVFGYNEEWLPVKQTVKVLLEGHKQWLELIHRPVPGLWTPPVDDWTPN